MTTTNSYSSLRIETLQRRDRVIGDDWTFLFQVTDNSLTPPAAPNLTNYTPGGYLNVPFANPIAITNSMVDIQDLAAGQFAFVIPQSITNSLLPDNTGYSLQVYLVDPSNVKTTYVIVPLRVLAV